jgi:hypothetical protein
MSLSEKITLPWQNLRSWDGSVRKAFEQMCNQFASLEATPTGSVFVPVAAPDGGVEGYWIYPDKTEWGFQAKFWTSPEQVDFAQIDGSITKALNTHPNLTRYTVCLPIDRQDPRKPNQTWLKDRWDEHVSKWIGWVAEKGRTMTFDYWGETELSTRFAEERHAGRYYFWFNKDLFSDNWFLHRLEETRANAGARYTPELNVTLDLSVVFDALVRGNELRRALAERFSMIRKVKAFVVTPEIAFASSEVIELNDATALVLHRLDAAISAPPTKRLDWESLSQAAESAVAAGHKFVGVMRDYEQGKRKQVAEAQEKPDRVSNESTSSMLSMHTGSAHTLIRALQELLAFVSDDVALAADVPAVLLTGGAGSGKTHLLCDFAFSRLDVNAPAILLLGQHFVGTENPWQQVLSQLGLQCSPEEFLGALSAAGQARKQVSVLMIDALNEGQGRRLWHSHLAGLLLLASRYPFVRVILSVRQTYVDACIPEQLSEDKLLRVEHRGFANNVLDAVAIFFDHYKIVPPSVPILNPEFHNPLFLKLFCQGFFNRGLHVIPKGMSGMTAVFSFFIDSIDDKLSKPDRLDFDKKQRIVFEATERLADAMAAKGTGYLDRSDVDHILRQIYPSVGFEQSLLRNLISEGLLNEDMIPGGENVEVIHFAYERLGDFLIADRLLEANFNPAAPSTSFAVGGPLHQFVKSEWEASMSQGLIEAFTVHLAEKHQVELADVASHARGYRAVRSAFTASFALRDEKAFNDATIKYINSTILKRKSDAYELNDAIINVATLPGHPFNAHWLHKHLEPMSMPTRDALWTVYLWESYDSQGSVDRLVKWATGKADLSILSDESAVLSGLALGWLLTSSNRAQRDMATKGLVRVFTNRIGLLLPVLKKLTAVNDPYVVERILAVAYGATMRSAAVGELKALAEWIYEMYFEGGTPPANILIRDYARGVIELALHRGVQLKISKKKIRPPYKSLWPSSTPSRTELEAIYGWSGEDNEKVRRAWYSIFGSVMGDGDFARYVIGTNWGSFHWFSVPLNKPLPEGANRYSGPNLSFDLDVAQCWIFNRVVELGWSPELFEKFDHGVSSEYRRQDKPERIGKKYQWIAYYEFVALVADNFHYAADGSDPGDERYEGPWQVSSARNIDPSSLLTNDLSDSETPAWWAPPVYALQTIASVDAWVRNAGDLPDVSPMLQVTNPADGSTWLVLESVRKVSDPKPLGEERFDTSFRQVWVEARAYLVKKTQENKLLEWMREQNFWGRWMPESSSQTHVFMGEFHWAPAYRAVDNYYNGNPGWGRKGQRELPVAIAQTAALYLRERGYDCSVEESLSVRLPTKTLADALELRWSGHDGLFNDAAGSLAVYDPTANTAGPSALLVRKEVLEKLLAEKSLALVWMVFGGKQYMQRNREEWKGELQMNGAYRLNSAGVEGYLSGTYNGPTEQNGSHARKR